MDKAVSFFKFVFHTSVLFLIIISLFPGSLIGFFLYGDLGKQPDLIQNPFGTALGYGMTGLGIAGQLGYQPFGNPTAYANPYGGGVSPIGSGSGYMS